MYQYILEATILFALSLGLVLYYAHPSAPYYARALVLISIFITFIGFSLLPLDIYQNGIGKQQTIEVYWLILYYVNFIMCWIVLPMVQQYENSGQFTFWNKLKDAILINSIIFGVIILGSIIIIVYIIIAGWFTPKQIPFVIAGLVNVFGLILVSIFLGYGLSSFPKQFYHRRNYKKMVKKCHREASALKQQQQQLLQQIYEIRQALKAKNQQNEQVNTILVLISENFPMQSFKSFAIQQNPKIITFSLAKLHKMVKMRIIQYTLCESKLDNLVDNLKSITQSYSSNHYKYRKIYYLTLFLIFLLVSIIIFIAQFTAFFSFMSPLNLLNIIDWSSPASYILNCILMTYMVYIISHSVFRIKIYRIYGLNKRHSTASSMIFSAINLSRVCFPLCYNVLQVTQMPKTSFQQFFGQVNIDQKFAFAFPLLMILFALFNLLDIYDKILRFLGLSSWAFDQEQAQQKRFEGRTILIERLRTRNLQNNTLQMMQLL